MRILVTGGTGFSGSYLIEALNDGDSEVHGTTRDTPPQQSDAKWHKLDLQDTEATNRMVEQASPEVIYHLAAFSSPGESYSHPQETLIQTATVQINIYEACLKANISPKILLVSSGQIYGLSDNLPITEDTPLDCSSPYAVAKLAQENLANYYLKRGIETVIARPFNHIGPRQKLGFIVADLARQVAIAEHQGSASAVIRVGNLSSRRDFTDVRDIVKAYILLIAKGKAGEIYNVCTGRSISGEEILEELLRNSRVNIKIEKDPSKMRPADIPDLYGDPTKLKKATGWEPEYSLSHVICETLDYWREKIKE